MVFKNISKQCTITNLDTPKREKEFPSMQFRDLFMHMPIRDLFPHQKENRNHPKTKPQDAVEI